jgi:hypothetical protein
LRELAEPGFQIAVRLLGVHWSDFHFVFCFLERRRTVLCTPKRLVGKRQYTVGTVTRMNSCGYYKQTTMSRSRRRSINVMVRSWCRAQRRDFR